MSFNETDYNNLKQKAAKYQEVLQNTQNYRQAWQDELRQSIVQQLQEAIDAGGLPGKVELRSGIQNLEAVVLNLGSGHSGIGEPYQTARFIGVPAAV
jgi:hypothetical protein